MENIEGELKTKSEATCSLRKETHRKIAGVSFCIDDVGTKDTQNNEILRSKFYNITYQLNELTDELEILFFVIEEVIYNVGLLTLIMDVYDEH